MINIRIVGVNVKCFIEEHKLFQHVINGTYMPLGSIITKSSSDNLYQQECCVNPFLYAFASK